MKSMTTAQKAKAELVFAGIRTEIINLDPMLTKNGCAYGLSFSCTDRSRLERILKTKKIAHGEIIGSTI